MTPQVDEHTKRLYAAAYVAGERLIEATATWQRLFDSTDADAWDQDADSAAERTMHEASTILASVLAAAGLPHNARRLVWGAAGLMELELVSARAAGAVWREEPVDVRPPRRERPLWRSTAVAGGTA